MTFEEIGYVKHWFGQAGVAGVQVTRGTLKAGDSLYFKGHTTDFQETITTIQLKNKPVAEAHSGEAVGLKVSRKVREFDKVFKVLP